MPRQTRELLRLCGSATLLLDKIDSHLVIFDCCFRLNEENASLAELGYGHLDLHFHRTDVYSQFKMKGCGVRLFEDCSNTLPRIWEEDDEKIDGGNASEGGGGQRDESNKRMRIINVKKPILLTYSAAAKQQDI